MICEKHYSLKFISLFLDDALRCANQFAEHAQNCSRCQTVITNLEMIEKEILQFEENQENFISFSIFNTVQQQRDILKLSWQTKWLKFEGEQLSVYDSFQENSIAIFLHCFWYGNVGIYTTNHNFPLQILIQRRKRYIKVPSNKTQRIIEDDALLLSDQTKPILKISTLIPGIFKENSITHKYKSLSHVSPSFIWRFFQKKSHTATIESWSKIKKNLSAREIGIYLMLLQNRFSYERISQDFRISSSRVAKIVFRIRKKMLWNCYSWKL